MSNYGLGSFKYNISYKLFMVPSIKLYLYYYVSSSIINVSFYVSQFGIYNSYGKRDLVVTTQKKGKEI